MEQEKKDNLLLLGIIFIAGVIAGSAMIYSVGRVAARPSDNLAPALLGGDGVVLPLVWGDLGVKLVESGVIDGEQFNRLYAGRGLDAELRRWLKEKSSEKIVINSENSGLLLNLFWALGLGNKNQILDEGPMADSRYEGAGGFASTGGWTLSKGVAMSHYSRHGFFELTSDQQAVVERVAKNIYRPCCNNSTYFPDCNHGMAMLGLLELMASQGASEAGMYKSALAANSFWFPDNYHVIAEYFKRRGVSWDKVDPKAILSASYSSATGYQRVASEVGGVGSGGSGCGVDAGASRPVRAVSCGVE